MNPSGKGKLSKRTQSFTDDGQEVLVKVEEFRSAGLLPEVVVNFLANVGWSFGDDVEKFTLDEALPRFELGDINPAPSRLNYTKLDWLNGQYIQELDPLKLAKLVKPFLDQAGLEVNPAALLAVMPPMSKRLKRLPEAIAFLRFLFDDMPFDLKAEQVTHKKMPYEAARQAFQEARELVATIEPFDVGTLGPALMALGERVTENGKAGPFLGTARLAVTAQKVSPPLFESMVALGRERTLARLDEVIELLTVDD
jgi:glutamyl-tRNA synthetase